MAEYAAVLGVITIAAVTAFVALADWTAGLLELVRAAVAAVP
jgi:hypothetical protein